MLALLLLLLGLSVDAAESETLVVPREAKWKVGDYVCSARTERESRCGKVTKIIEGKATLQLTGELEGGKIVSPVTETPSLKKTKAKPIRLKVRKPAQSSSDINIYVNVNPGSSSAEPVKKEEKPAVTVAPAAAAASASNPPAVPAPVAEATPSSATTDPPRRHSLSAAVGLQHDSYRESDFADLNLLGLTVSANAKIAFLRRASIEAEGSLTALPLSGEGNSNLRFYRASATAGYLWRVAPIVDLGIDGGVAFRGMVGSSLDFGFKQLTALQLFPRATVLLSSQSELSFRAGFSPVLADGPSFFSSREIFASATWARKMEETRSMRLTLAYSHLKSGRQSVVLTDSQLALTAGYGW